MSIRMEKTRIIYLVLISVFFSVISFVWLIPNIESDGITYYMITKMLVEHNKIDPGNVPEDILNIRRTTSRVDGRPGFLYSCGYAFYYYPFLRFSKLLPESLEDRPALSDFASISNRDVLGITIGTLFYTFFALIISFLLLIRFFPPFYSFLSVIMLYLGTPFFYYSQFSPSYAHGLVIFLLTASIYVFLLMINDSENHSMVFCLLFGALSGSIIMVQNFNIIFIIPYILYFFLRKDPISRKNISRLMLFLCGIIPFIIIIGLYNYSLYGEFFTSGYLHISHEFKNIDQQFSIFTFNLPKYFISRSRGIFLWSPLFFFSLLGLFYLKEKKKLLYICGTTVIIFFCFMNFYNIWHGGKSFGPRILLGLFPYLAIMLASIVSRHKMPIIILLIVLSIYTLFLANMFLIYQKAMTDKENRKMLGENHKVGFNLNPAELYSNISMLAKLSDKNKNPYLEYIFEKNPPAFIHWISQKPNIKGY